MSDIDLWDRIESVREKAGITENNFRVYRKYRGYIPESWIGRLQLASKELDVEIPVEQLVALSFQPTSLHR